MARERCRRRRNPDERGVSAVEFALVLPLLLALMLGIITAGLGYNNVLGLSDGVREGARFGATTLNGAGWGAAVQQQTIDLTYLNRTGQNVVTASMVCAQLVKTTASTNTVLAYSSNCAQPVSPPTNQAGAVPANPSGVPVGTCLVKVWGTIPVKVEFILIPTQTIQVIRQSVSLYERSCP
jgi:Flp pilus assembly protein TadG